MEELNETPHQVLGPFYPDEIALDADLVKRTGHMDTASGEIVIIEGVVKNEMGRPLKEARVEIWQACASGKYNHPHDPNPASLDPHFKYWGKSITDADGFYRFRTIIPGSYPAEEGWNRPAHVHFKITCTGFQEVITQMYFKQDVLNEADQILQNLEKHEQAQLIVEFEKRAGENHPVGQFDIRLRKIN